MKWISIKDKEIPKDGEEYITRNELQGGSLQLIYWDKIHNVYKSKGEVRIGANTGSHWLAIPLFI